MREQTGELITGNISTDRWEELSLGLFEAIVEESMSMGFKSIRMDDRRYNQRLHRPNIPYEDLQELSQDFVSKIVTRVNLVSERINNEHKWVYKLLPTLGILVGYDPRDLIADPTESIFDLTHSREEEHE